MTTMVFIVGETTPPSFSSVTANLAAVFTVWPGLKLSRTFPWGSTLKTPALTGATISNIRLQYCFRSLMIKVLPREDA